MPAIRRSRLRAAAVLVCLWATSGASAQPVAPEFDHALVAVTALEKHIRPGFERLTAAFSELGQATARCEGEADFQYTYLKPAFRKAVLAWGRVAHLNFGPLAA